MLWRTAAVAEHTRLLHQILLLLRETLVLIVRERALSIDYFNAFAFVRRVLEGRLHLNLLVAH